VDLPKFNVSFLCAPVSIEVSRGGADGMNRDLQAFSPVALFRRWRSLDNRGLWLALAALLAMHALVLSLLTQPADEAINALLVMGGAGLWAPLVV